MSFGGFCGCDDCFVVGVECVVGDVVVDGFVE